jgi:hypothetical protein
LKRVRKSAISIFGDASDIINIHHSRPKYFFGFDMVAYGDFKIPVSDNEKTLIDLFYYRVRLPIQDYGQLLTSVNLEKLGRYLAAYDEHTKITVTNFVQKYRKLAKKGGLESPY